MRPASDQPESLGHVLNTCTTNCGLMRERHNTLLQRLVRAIPKEGNNLYAEQTISRQPAPGLSSSTTTALEKLLSPTCPFHTSLDRRPSTRLEPRRFRSMKPSAFGCSCRINTHPYLSMPCLWAPWASGTLRTFHGPYLGNSTAR